MNTLIEMVKTSFNKKTALDILESHRIFGKVTEKQYQKIRELIRKEFNSHTKK